MTSIDILKTIYDALISGIIGWAIGWAMNRLVS
jgi:hypothetical protein